MNTDMYGNCNTCGQKLGTATAGHTCVIDVSKLPKYYSEAEYNLLLSSEQAWREEAEVLMRGANAHNKRAHRLKEHLNQAVEVLKSVEQRLRKPTTDKCECPTCQAVQYIEQFLSSLSQGTEGNHESNNHNSALGDTYSDR